MPFFDMDVLKNQFLQLRQVTGLFEITYDACRDPLKSNMTFDYTQDPFEIFK